MRDLRIPIQPPQFARRIWIAAWQALGSACFALANDRRDCAVLGLLVLLTSLNYWRHPVQGWRRRLDMVAATGSLGYQVVFVAPYASCPSAAALYTLSVAVSSPAGQPRRCICSASVYLRPCGVPA
jgi:hypothetical protein